MAGVDWKTSTVEAGGTKLHLRRAGKGRPLLVLHHETGTLDDLPFYDALAARYDVLVPHHPGYSRSERPDWMRSVRDIAVIYRGLLSELKVSRPALVGLGFGGWIAAEVATMAPADLSHLVLVGAMGIKPLPASLGRALEVMEESDLVADILGEHVFDFFLRNKRQEWLDYRHEISQFELNRYLPRL